jgi:hypothetical protein
MTCGPVLIVGVFALGFTLGLMAGDIYRRDG